MSEHLTTPDNTLATALEVLGTALQIDRARSPGTFPMVADEVNISVHELLLDEYSHEEAAFIFRVWHDRWLKHPAAAA